MEDPINYKISQEVRIEVFKAATDDPIVRELIHRMIMDIPLEKLKKLINFEVISPEINKYWDIYDNREMLNRLSNNRTVLIRGNIWI